MLKQYYIDLINRLYKVLVWYENYPNAFKAYVENLKIEIRGNEDYSSIQRIYYLLNYLSITPMDELEHKIVKKIALDSIGIIDEILSNWKE